MNGGIHNGLAAICTATGTEIRRLIVREDAMNNQAKEPHKFVCRCGLFALELVHHDEGEVDLHHLVRTKTFMTCV